MIRAPHLHRRSPARCAALARGCVSLFPKAKPAQLYRFGGRRRCGRRAGTAAASAVRRPEGAASASTGPPPATAS